MAPITVQAVGWPLVTEIREKEKRLPSAGRAILRLFEKTALHSLAQPVE